MPSLKTTKDRGAKIPINAVKQYAANKNLVLEYAECSTSRLVFFAKKLSVAEKKAFTRTMSDMLYTCGATLQEFINPNAENNNKQTSILEKCFVRANNNCGKPVEALCYSVEYPDCGCHCGSKRRLVNARNEHSMRKSCRQKKKPPVMKRKRKALDIS